MTKQFPVVRLVSLGCVGLAVAIFLCLQVETSAQQASRQQAVSPVPSSAASVAASGSGHRVLLDRYCVTCHNNRAKTAELTLDQIDAANPAAHAEVWEKVVHKLRTGTMPPSNMPQPSGEDRRALVTWLETSLDAASADKPNPGRTDTLRRLNRTDTRMP